MQEIMVGYSLFWWNVQLAKNFAIELHETVWNALGDVLVANWEIMRDKYVSDSMIIFSTIRNPASVNFSPPLQQKFFSFL